MHSSKNFTQILGLFLILLLCRCTTTKQVQFNILQTNDVYEISPLENGKVGGMARVAQLKKELSEANPNIISIMAGDFFNPSIYGSLKFEGERIRGRQMVETMNVAGIDLVTFGNHEFDLKEADFLKRVNESTFDWIIANAVYVKDGNQSPFSRNGQEIPAYQIKTYQNEAGKSVKVGFIGICINSNEPNYVSFSDPIESFKKVYEQIKNEVDVVVGLTHQSIEEDKALAAAFPEIHMILGGHEHNNMLVKVDNVQITKADANAKTAYIHQIKYNTVTKKVKVKSTLKKINEQVANEPNTQKIVDKWANIAVKSLKESGIDPEVVLTTLKEPLDAREEVIRNKPTRISSLIAKSISAAYPEAQGSVLNTGSIRVDDVLTGQITEYDIARTLPFGGAIILVEMKGSLLLKLLETGRTANVGTGGFLALDQITFDTSSKQGTIQGQAIKPETNYKIAMPSFLISGNESNLDYFTKDNPEIIKITEPDENSKRTQTDIRLTLIDYLKNNPIE